MPLFVSGVFANPALLAAQSPVAKQGLNFSVGNRGLESLSFNGQSLFSSPQSGELRPWESVFRAALDALLFHTLSPVATRNKQTGTIDLVYGWGRVVCAYGKQGDRITMRIEVSNTGANELDQLSLRLMELNFPRIPIWYPLRRSGNEWRAEEIQLSIQAKSCLRN